MGTRLRLPVSCALFLCLSRGLEARTVSTLMDLGTTASAPTLYGGGGGAGSGAQYRGGTSGYGQRSVPAESVRKIRNDEERPYETHGTYEYMTDPSKKSSRTRVPETEKRPPGDDVEMIYDRGAATAGKNGNGDRDHWSRDYGESRTSKRKTSAPRTASGSGYGQQDRYGYVGGGGGPRYVDPDVYGYAGRAGSGPRFKDPPETKRYVNGDGEPIVDRPSSSSSGGDRKSQRHDKKPAAAPKKKDDARLEIDEVETVAAKKNAKGKGGSGKGGNDGRREEVDEVMDEPGKKKVHKKNEYSKKQEFFDEEHVKGPMSVPAEAAAAASGTSAARERGKTSHKTRQDPRKKRKRRAKKVKKKSKKRGSNGFSRNGFGGGNGFNRNDFGGGNNNYGSNNNFGGDSFGSNSFGSSSSFGGKKFGNNNFGGNGFGRNGFGGNGFGDFGSSASGSDNHAGRAVVRPAASTTDSSWSGHGRIVVVR